MQRFENRKLILRLAAVIVIFIAAFCLYFFREQSLYEALKLHESKLFEAEVKVSVGSVNLLGQDITLRDATLRAEIVNLLKQTRVRRDPWRTLFDERYNKDNWIGWNFISADEELREIWQMEDRETPLTDLQPKTEVCVRTMDHERISLSYSGEKRQNYRLLSDMERFSSELNRLIERDASDRSEASTVSPNYVTKR